MLPPFKCKSSTDCSGHGDCVAGSCACALGWTGRDCRFDSCPEGTPVRRRPDGASHGHCSGNGLCLAGRCSCTEGYTGDDCSTRSGPNGPSGAPSKQCSGHGALLPRLNRCLCDEGYGGESCESDTCPGHCSGHGACVRGTCECASGYHGDACERQKCPGLQAECSARGKCDTTTGECQCSYGWTGPDCSVASCAEGCNGHGYCLGVHCMCVPGWEGDACERRSDGLTNTLEAQIAAAAELERRALSDHAERGVARDDGCAHGCSGHGRCVAGAAPTDPSANATTSTSGGLFRRFRMSRHRLHHCECENGWSGAACDTPACVDGCSGRGFCISGKCACDRCWAGPTCTERDYSAGASCHRDIDYSPPPPPSPPPPRPPPPPSPPPHARRPQRRRRHRHRRHHRRHRPRRRGIRPQSTRPRRRPLRSTGGCSL